MEVRSQEAVVRGAVLSSGCAEAAPWASTVTVPVQQSPGACASLSAVTSFTWTIIDNCWYAVICEGLDVRASIVVKRIRCVRDQQI